MNLSAVHNPNFKDQTLWNELVAMFKDRTDAKTFLLEYGEYVENIDDEVDEPKDKRRTRTICKEARTVFNLPYYQKYRHILFMVELLIHNQYFDSVEWETAPEEWKRRDAKCLSHAAHNMLFAVIVIEFGESKLAEISLRFREHAHERHLHDVI